MWNIFEQPWTLLIAGVITLLVLLTARQKLAEKHIWWPWLLPIVLVAAAFALDFFVQTDLEKINAAITAVVKAVEDENPDAIEPIIGDNYHDSLHGTKKDLLFFCRRKFSEPLVEKNIKRIVSIDISGPKAIAVFTVRVVFDQRSYIYQVYRRLILTKVKVELQKQPDNQWLISRAELLEIDLQPTSWRNIKQIRW
jgi:hypothetical protein